MDKFTLQGTLDTCAENDLTEEFARDYHFVKQDIFELRSLWATYRAFFGVNKERVDLLNSVSGAVTGLLERTLFETALLKLRKLTDPKETGRSKNKKRNTSVQTLPDFFEEHERKELKHLVEIAIESCEFAKNWANKKIAHSDYDYRNGNLKLDCATRGAVTQAIDDLVAVVKWIERTKFHRSLITHPYGAGHGAVEFLTYLFEGQEALEAKEKASRALARRGHHNEARSLNKRPPWLLSEDQKMDVD